MALEFPLTALSFREKKSKVLHIPLVTGWRYAMPTLLKISKMDAKIYVRSY